MGIILFVKSRILLNSSYKSLVLLYNFHDMLISTNKAYRMDDAWFSVKANAS